jgi:D-sedoheptulose 7-phosphate isomerase
MGFFFKGDMDNVDWFRNYMRETSANYNDAAELCAAHVAQATSIIASVFAQGKRLLLVGNGIDASLCEMIAARFTSRFSSRAPRQGWPALSLTTNTNFLTGHSNKYGVDEVYARLVSALGAKGDALLAIESGDPGENVAWAVRKAEGMGIHTIAMVGFSSKLAKMSTVAIRIPLKDGPRISEIQMAIQHAICYLVEKELLK